MRTLYLHETSLCRTILGMLLLKILASDEANGGSAPVLSPYLWFLKVVYIVQSANFYGSSGVRGTVHFLA